MKYLLWTHLATTGTDPVEDYILEMYMRVTLMDGAEPWGENCKTWYSGVPRCLTSNGHLRLNQPDSLRIHARSGLLTDFQQQRGATFNPGRFNLDVDECLRDLDGEIWLAGYAPRFTWEFLRYHAPAAFHRLHFQQLDVTSLESALYAAWDMDVFKRPEALRVRAKVDSALWQYRTYLGVLRQLAGRT